MPATYAIAEALNAIIMTLDPVQRWQSAQRFSGSWITEKWFIMIALSTLTMLIFIIFIANLYRSSQKNKAQKAMIANIAKNKGLSLYEMQILKNMAVNPGIKNKIEVLTSKKVFDDSVKRIIDKQKQLKNPEQIEKLKTELKLLRAKLGFREAESIAAPINTEQSTKINTRQISTGQKLYIQTTTSQTDAIESTIIENTDTGLKAKLTTHPQINFTEQWTGHYTLKGRFCEFDTSVISYDGNCLVLAHSENVRCSDRRRFSRAPIEHQALVALFPQNKSTEDKNTENKTDTNATENAQQSNSSALCPPEFINAAVTEIGGPGLKLKTDLKARQGDRILVILDLSEQNSSDDSENKSPGEIKQKIVQDIAVVRRVEKTPDGSILAAEMFGLSDEFIEELVHAANTAPTDANTAPTDANAAPTDANAAPTDANTNPTDANAAQTDANTAATDEPQEKNDNTNNTNINEENQQPNIAQEA